MCGSQGVKPVSVLVCVCLC